MATNPYDDLVEVSPEVNANPYDALVADEAPRADGGGWTPTALLDSPAIDGMQLVPLVPNEEDEAAKDERIRTLHERAVGDNPEHELEAFDLAQLSGARIDDVRARIDEFRRAYKAPEFDARKWRYENPELAAILLEHPQLLPLVDVRDNWLKRAWRTLTSTASAALDVADKRHSFDSQEEYQAFGQATMADAVERADKINAATSKRQDKSHLSTSDAALDAAAYTAKHQAIALRGMTQMGLDLRDINSAEAREKREETLRLQQDLGAPGYYGEGVGRAFATTAGETLGNQASSVLSLGAAALLGSATRNPKLGVAAAKALTMATSFPIETGGTYLEMRQTRDENGKLMEPLVAAGAALLYGVVATTIETGMMDVRLAGFAGFKEAVKQGGGKAWLKEAVQNPTIRDRLMALGKQLAGNAREEAKQEGLQQAWELVTQWAGSSVSAGEAQDVDLVGAVEQVGGAAIGGGLGGVIGLGGAQSIANTGHALINMSASRKDGNKIAAITELAGAPETKAAPRQVAKVIELATQRDGEKVTHVYVDPKRFVEQVESGGGTATDVDEAATALMGEQGPQRLRDALAMAGDAAGTRAVLEVPLVEYLERWGGTELAQALAEDVAVQPGRETLREQRLFQGGVKRIAKQLADEEERQSAGDAAGAEQTLTAAERRFADTMLRQLVDAGQDPADARHGVALNLHLYQTLAAKTGRSVEEVLPDLSVHLADGVQELEPGSLGQPAVTRDLRPASLDVLRQDYDAKPEGERKQRYFRDRNTRLRNFRALEKAGADPAKPMLALFSPEGAKFFNDRFGHGSVDGALRVMADALRTVEGETGAKVGSDVGAWVRDEAHAEQIAAAMRAAMPAGVQITYAVGPRQESLRKTIDVVAAKHKETRLAAVKQRSLGGRAGAPAAFLQGEPGLAIEEGMDGLALDSTEAQDVLGRAAERAAPVAEALRGAAAPSNETALSPELEQAFAEDLDPFETIHLDKSGLLSEDGFAQARELAPKKFVMSADLRGFAGLNTAFGRAGTDAIKAWFSTRLARLGAGQFDTANLHGDEYAAHGDNEEQMRRFFGAVQEQMSRVVFWDYNEDGSISMQAGLYFAYGIDRDEDTADRVQLKAEKERQDAAGKVRGVERVRSRKAFERKLREHAKRVGGVRGVDNVLAVRCSDLVRERREAEARGSRERDLASLRAADPAALADALKKPGSPESAALSRVVVERLEQPAWHGTPHRGIDKFSLDKIGTGEGAQAYGWGLYFASKKEVAEHYRKKLSSDHVTIDGIQADKWSDERSKGPVAGLDVRLVNWILSHADGADTATVIAKTRTALQKYVDTWSAEKAPRGWGDSTHPGSTLEGRKELLARLDTFLAEHRVEVPQGQTYKVEVPADEELLDYDKPMHSQPPGVLERLEKAGIVAPGFARSAAKYREVSDRMAPIATEAALGVEPALAQWRVLSEERDAVPEAEDLRLDGSQFYRLLAEELGEEEDASRALGAAGIPGLRYLDGASRKTGKGHHNYVIWDEGRVSVVETLYQPRIKSPGDAFDTVMAESFADRQNPVSAIEDSRYLQWKGDKKSHEKPGPYGGEQDGTFDAVNEHLQLKGDQKVSGAREAWDKLWSAESGPWNQRVRAVIEVMRQVPGLEGLRLPDEFIAADVEETAAALEAEIAQQPRGWIDMARDGARRQFKIFLTPRSDLSTFLHESAHAYFEMLGDLSEHADAPANMRQDWQAVLEWLGAKDRASLTVEHKEKFARGFEAYLMEGKAPSSELAEAFATFRQWLKHIYINIRALGVKLNPEIRQVFGRMLATDAEIERARSAVGVDKPMDRETLGMTGPEHEAYLKKRVQDTSTATLRMQKAYAEADLRALKAYKSAEFKRYKAQAKEEWDARPDVRAWRYVKLGETLVDGKPFASSDIGRMDKYEVGKAVGPYSTIHKKLTGRLIKNGESPSTVADGFGFKSAKAMLTALAALPDEDTWVRQRAEQLLKEAHPEIDGDIANAQRHAEDVVHQSSLDSVLLEWRALSKRAGRGEDTPLESIKHAAADLVKRRYTAGRLDPGVVLQRERTNANEAAIAAAKGNFKQALAYKRLQVLHHFMWRELRKAVEDRNTFQDLAAKMGAKKQQERLGRAGKPYRDVTNSILEALDLAEKEELLEPRQGISELEKVMAENSDAVVFDVDVINTLLVRPRNWRDLTLDEMRKVTEALKNIRQGARNMTDTIDGDERRDREEVKADLIAEAMQSRLAKERAPLSAARATDGIVTKVMGGLRSADGSLLEPETMLRWLGGEDTESTWYQATIKPLQDAKAREADIYKEVVGKIAQAFERIPSAVRARLSENIDGRDLFPDHIKDAVPSKRLHLIMMIPHRGNHSNLERLTRGRNITVPQIDAALATLTREELEFGQSIVDAYESLWPLVRALEEDDTGVAPTKIEAAPYTITTATGEVVEMAGGYAPAAYDSRLVRRPESRTEGTVASLMEGGMVRPVTSRGHTRERAETYADVISLDPGIIQSHLMRVAHDLAFRRPLRSVARLLIDPDIRKVIDERLGGERAAYLVPWLRDIGQMEAAEASENLGALDGVLRWFKSNTPRAVLGYAFDNFIADPISTLTASIKSELKTKHLAAALLELSTPWRFMDARKLALEKSGEARFRDLGEIQDFRRTRKAFTSSNRNITAPARWFIDHAFTVAEWMDAYASTVIWYARYRQGLVEGLDDKAAAEKGNQLLRQKLPSGSVVDKSALRRNKGFWGVMVMMYGYGSKVYQIQREILQPVFTAETGAERAKAGAAAAAQWMAIGLIVGAFAEFVTGRGPTDDDGEDEAERWMNWTLRQMAFGPLSLAIPFIRMAGRSSGASGVKDIPDVVSRAARLLEDGAAAEDVLRLLRASGAFTGWPTVRPVRWAEGLLDANEGEGSGNVASDIFYGQKPGNPRNPLNFIDHLSD